MSSTPPKPQVTISKGKPPVTPMSPIGKPVVAADAKAATAAKPAPKPATPNVVSFDSSTNPVGQPSFRESIESAIAAEKAKDTPKPRKDRRNLKVAIGAVCLVVGVLTSCIYAYYTYFKKETYVEPALNAVEENKAKFVVGKSFEDLDWGRKQVWIKEIADHKKNFEELYNQGKIPKNEMAEILAVASLGKQFERVDKYFSLGGEVARKEYLNQLINKEARDKELSDAGVKTEFPVDKDKKKYDVLISKLPPDVSKEYDEFHKALKVREKEVEKQEKADRNARKAAANAAKASTRPTTRPGETPVVPAPK